MTETISPPIQYDLTGKRLGATTVGEKAWAFVTRPNVATAGIVGLFAAAAFAVAHYAPETVDAVRSVLSDTPWWVKQMAGPWIYEPLAVKASSVMLGIGAVVGAAFASKQARFQVLDAEENANDIVPCSLPFRDLVIEKNKQEPVSSVEQMEFAHEYHIRNRRAMKLLWACGAGALLGVGPMWGALGLGIIAPMIMQNNSNINRMKKVRHYEWRLTYRRREP